MAELSLEARNAAQSDTIKNLFDENERLVNKVAALQEEIELLRARWPRAYILTRSAEWVRLFREVKGYLATCHRQHGTDFAGRQHAMSALDQAIKDLQAHASATEDAFENIESEGKR